MTATAETESYHARFGHWLRTGRWPRAAPVEHKFNPYHDPRNGQFTFAPGGVRSLDEILVMRRQDAPERDAGDARGDGTGRPGGGRRIDAVLRPEGGRPAPILIQRGPRMGRGGNSRAFEDPMTLEQVFPGLRDQPAGAIIGLVDNVFDLTGPANRLTAEMSAARVNQLIAQVQGIDFKFRLESLGFPQTADGLARQIDYLRFARAAAIFRVKGDLQPLQVETLRFLQSTTDLAYAKAKVMLATGRLPIRVSKPLTVGNFVDRQTRRLMRERYIQFEIDSAGTGPVRVNRNEAMAPDIDGKTRRPDVRVGDVAFDVTLTRKTLKTPQVQGFFNAAFEPHSVVIVRPTPLGPESIYILPRPKVTR